MYTQELTTEVKAEMRAVLQHYGITQFKIRPVRRNYAFEQAGVAHAMQWVLKVTYPAGMPQLPLGLSGEPQHLHWSFLKQGSTQTVSCVECFVVASLM